MQRDERDGAPGADSSEPEGPSDYTIEDFDNFAPFGGFDEVDENPAAAVAAEDADDDSEQGVLEFESNVGPVADASPADSDPIASPSAGEFILQGSSGPPDQDAAGAEEQATEPVRVPADFVDVERAIDVEGESPVQVEVDMEGDVDAAPTDVVDVELAVDSVGEGPVVDAVEGEGEVEVEVEAAPADLVDTEITGEPVGADPVAAFEDTVEAAFEGGQTAAASEEDDSVGVPDFATFTSDQYMQTTTQEFVDLAREMAQSAGTEHEQSAVSAEIPGLESGIVGLEDIVAAGGDDPAAIPVAQRSNLALRVFTGLALAVIFFASLYDELFVGLFVLVVLFLSVGEFYSALVRSGHRPLGLFGMLGAFSALAGTWVWGLVAVPVAIAATLAATLVFFGMVAERRAPLTNTALTVLGTAWVGGMGAFIFEIIKHDNYGWLIVATVVTVALMDIASYFFGRRVGRHPLAPRVSPKKTIEGLIGGMFIALLVGVAFGLRDPFDLGTGLVLGGIVAILAPLGDLAVSVVKRSIGLKDMGTLLPGHGGLLDRIDAMLFVFPAAWIAFSWTGLLA